jgi:hypothetical protein
MLKEEKKDQKSFLAESQKNKLSIGTPFARGSHMGRMGRKGKAPPPALSNRR